MPLPPAANPVDAAALADELARYRVVDADRLNKLLTGFSGSGAKALLDHLIGRGALTPFQAERALAGETRALVLGPYRLTGRAGSGTFGPLYTAQHASKPGTFDVRLLPLRSLWKARQAKQLARVLASGVKHPAVAPLVEADSANGFHYLVWPHADGARLADRVAAHGPLPPGTVAALLGHLANALAACHARGAVHGALTPYSVALGPNGLPLLLELGAGALLAQNVADDESLFDSMSAAFASAGVLAFAAPELAGAPESPTPAADQYALGAVGYFALTGLSPYPHPALADQLRAKRAGPPPSAAIVSPAVPAELAAVIERMMAPAPADRFATLAEVEERLATLAVAASPEHADASLGLSELSGAQRSNGAISWNETGALRPAERDGSAASVTFELPDAPETLTDAARARPEPNRAATETPRAVPLPPRPEAAPVPDSASDAARLPAVPKPKAVTDPRLSAPTPVQWHSAEPGAAPDDDPDLSANRPPPNSVLWKKVKRNLLFWQAATDAVQVSVYGPAAVRPGQTVDLAVYLHTPDADDSVRTLARAFQFDAELVGTGYLTQEVARASELAVHVSVANAGVAKTMVSCEWRGQPRRLVFALHVPWESPEGAAPGLISVGQNNVRIGKIEFYLSVLPRKA